MVGYGLGGRWIEGAVGCAVGCGVVEGVDRDRLGGSLRMERMEGEKRE